MINLSKVFKMMLKSEGEILGDHQPRRKAIKQFAEFGKKVILATIPLSLGSMLKTAYAQNTNANVERSLQLSLTLKYLVADFYTQALSAPTLIPSGSALTAITTIRDQENQHVGFLTTTLQSLQLIPVNKPVFDFTGGKGISMGSYADVFINYDTFLALAQSFEDTVVRAFIGQAATLIGSVEVLTAISKIHSVDARHASHIRQIRSASGITIKPWITGNEVGTGAVVQATYEGEENETQGGVKITGINDQLISVAASTEAFDEPLTAEQVAAILDPFIV